MANFKVNDRDGAPGQALVTGAELYAEPSVTGLNSQPVDDHAAFALLGARPSAAPPLELQELAVRLLSEGSIAVVRNAHLGELELERRGIDPRPEGFSFLDGLLLTESGVPMTSRCFAQRFTGEYLGELREITRVFSRGAEAWSVRDFVNYRADGEAEIASASIPLNSVLVYPNGLGILYKSQRGFRRLEGIFRTVERLQGGVNAKTIIAGYLGNVEQAHDELARNDRDVALFPTGATVNRVASTAAIDQLMREFDTLLPLYLRRLHILQLTGDERLSGVSRRLAMAPMLAFVESVRRQIAEVLGQLGIGITFERLRLDSIEERAQKYALLKLMRDDAVLEPKEFQSAALQLVG
jgi:hypothetical protein